MTEAKPGGGGPGWISALPWLPGLALALAIATAARLISNHTGAIPDVLIALFSGIVVANALHLPETVRPGVRFVLNKVLRSAIILLGASLTMAAIVGLGAATLGLVLICVAVAMALGLVMARITNLPGAVGTLIGAGTAICGGTAVLAIGPMIAASEEEIAYAVTTIFTFNIIALLAYPPLGHALHLSSVAFGSWTGTAVNDTSVVVATGYVYSQAAGATATIVKLTRTLLLVPLAFVIGSAHAARARDGSGKVSSAAVFKAMPWFILGFAGMAVLNSTGLLPKDLSHALTLTASFLIVVVLSAVGLNVNLAKIGRMGFRPLSVGLALAAVMACVSLTLIHLLHSA
jgi:uncharacterized integral membrane protein (TIGR00698 family)